MPGPFPGMDPWLEARDVFPDFHSGFLSCLRAALNAALPPPFYAALSTRVWLEGSGRNVEPDVDVFLPAGADSGGGGVAVAPAPVAVELLEIEAEVLDDEAREAVVEIYAGDGETRLVTSVELLSPSNKTPGSGGRDLYRSKQQEMFAAGVNLVEIDLLRAGTHATLIPERRLRSRAGAFDYHACIHRADRWRVFRVAPLRLPNRLPALPIPLTPDVADVTADLQAVFDRCYDEALFGRRLRYAEPPDPPLTTGQAAWATEILRSKGVLP